MEPEVSLVGFKLFPGKPVAVNGREDSDSCIWTVHITQFALAADAKPGRNIVSVQKSDGSEFVLGSLVKDRCEQFTADFMIREDVKLVVSGSSEVHLTGYLTTTELLMPDVDDDFPGAEPEDEEELRALQDAEERLGGREFSDEELTEETSDEELEGMEDSDEDEEELDEEVPSTKAAKSLVKSAKAKPPSKQPSQSDVIVKRLQEREAAEKLKEQLKAEGAWPSSSEEDSEDEDLEDDKLELNGLAESSDDKPDDVPEIRGQPAVVAKVSGKRAGEPQVEGLAGKKKQKSSETPTVEQKQKPSSQPAAPPYTTADTTWESEIKKFVEKEGPQDLSRVGSVVKKPAGSTRKLKKLVQGSKLLVLSADDKVAVKK